MKKQSAPIKVKRPVGRPRTAVKVNWQKPIDPKIQLSRVLRLNKELQKSLDAEIAHCNTYREDFYALLEEFNSMGFMRRLKFLLTNDYRSYK